MIAPIRIVPQDERKAIVARLWNSPAPQRQRPQIALVRQSEANTNTKEEVAPRVEQQEDWHVRSWWAWKAMCGDDMLIMQYVRACCWMAGATIEEVRGESRKSDIVSKRHVVIKSTCMRFPEVSQVRMGKLFNRDHTVIGWVMRCKTKRFRPDRKFSGTKNSQAKLTEADIRAIRAEGQIGGPYMPLARQYGVTNETIRNIVTGKTWKHLI